MLKQTESAGGTNAFVVPSNECEQLRKKPRSLVDKHKDGVITQLGEEVKV